MASYLKDIFGTGTNIFGASAGMETDLLKENGLLSQADIDKAENASLMQGLIGTGISYLAQPKNQDYGSFAPYLGKALAQGMEQAKTPFTDLRSSANTSMKLEEYQMTKQKRERAARSRELMDRIYNPDGSMNEDVLMELRATDPAAYLQYQQLDLNDSKIFKNNAEAQAELAGDGITMAKPNPKDFTPESWAEYTATGNSNRLRADKRKDVADIQKIRMEILNTQGQDALDQFDQQRGVGANQSTETPNITMDDSIGTPHDFVNSQGVKVTPIIYDTSQPMSEIKKYRRDQGKVTNAYQSQSEVLRRERNKIRELISSGNVGKITGIAGQIFNMPGGGAADADAMLYGIRQLEFISNYQRIKQAGGGFGSLTEKEGDRLEQMAAVLDDKQSEEQFVKNLLVLDKELEKFEKLDRDKFEDIYGKTDYSATDLTPLTGKYGNGRGFGSPTEREVASDAEIDAILGL
jgi:hypothetical protein